MSKKYEDDMTDVSGPLRPRRRSQGWRREFSHMFDGGGALMAVKVQNQVVLHETPTGRLRLTASIYEKEGRPFESLTVQRWDGEGRPLDYFALNTKECRKFLEFVDRIKRTTFDRVGGFRVRDNENKTVLLAEDIDFAALVGRFDPTQVEALAKIAEENSLRDLQAVAYRRAQLEHFKRLLNDKAHREEERQKYKGPEKLWQVFFERNPWIFGCGLSYLPLGKLSGRTLEAYLRGASIGGVGKEADAVMKSNALISAICVAEIKSPFDHHLLDDKPERAGVYHPSRELSAAVAQVQVSVQMAVEEYGHSLAVEAKDGERTGEELHFVQPRAFLVVGHLGEFKGEFGTNNQKYRSFEVYRRSLSSPEILTFDELYERARHIVEFGPEELTAVTDHPGVSPDPMKGA